MPEDQPNNGLHLPDLTIKGFRGIKDLSLPRLGRVTLLAGKNGVGKSTVLEAVAVYAARRYCNEVLSNMLKKREELSSAQDENGDTFPVPNVEALFHGWDASKNTFILIGPSKEADQLRIENASHSDLANEQMELEGFRSESYHYDNMQWLNIKFRGKQNFFPWANLKSRRPLRGRWGFDAEVNLPKEIKCETLGPGLLTNDEIAKFWDKIALTSEEDQAVNALKLIFGDKVERIAVTAEEYKQHGRRVIVKLKDHSDPVPLKSLGDGAIRLFSVALALANSRDGILLIDEAENGIHHSVQPDFWRMVLRMARENNTQVLATTHSWDCVRGFALAATDNEDAEGILYRLEQDDEDVWAIFYPEDQLKIAAEQGTEVR